MSDENQKPIPQHELILLLFFYFPVFAIAPAVIVTKLFVHFFNYKDDPEILGFPLAAFFAGIVVVCYRIAYHKRHKKS